MTPFFSSRRGSTLIELLMGLIIVSIVGVSLVKLLTGQGRFLGQQEAWRTSRGVSRSSLNRLYSDIRNVEATNGVEAAASGGKDVTLRVPYAFGVMCSGTAAGATLSLLPVDSAMFAAGGYSGFAYRDASGAYTYVSSTTAPAVPGTTANCTGASITTLGSINGSPTGQIVNVTGAIATVPPVGSVFFLYRRVRYEFKNSVILAGRTGLWRTLVSTGATEELAAPFATTARVNFYVNNATTAQSAVPTLSTIRGFELVLSGESEKTPYGNSSPKTTLLTTSVFFTNRPD
jgi:hypothetical protein